MPPSLGQKSEQLLFARAQPIIFEDLARYIIRACFSHQRMTYLPAKEAMDGQAKVIYRSKDGRTSKTFEALDWLAQLVIFR